MKDNTYSFKDAFGKFLKEQHLDEKFKQKQLIDSWERIMGRPIAARTTKIYFKDKMLFVELSSASLKDEMNRSNQAVIERLKEQMPELEIDQVRFL